MFNKPPVVKSADFNRVLGLPVRDAASYPPNLVQAMTKALKLPTADCPGGDTVDSATGCCPVCGSPQELLDVQARALWDLGTHGRLFGPIAVGNGKSLITFLGPRVIDSRNPVLFIPAKLVQKSEREWRREGRHWRVAKHLRFRSYEYVGRVSGANWLDLEKPDLIILDEAHKAKNPKAAVTRRIARYVEHNPKTVLVPLTGSMMKGSVKDFAHLSKWSHGQLSPLPLYAGTLIEWAEALDEGLNPMARRSPGVLTELWPWAIPESAEAAEDTAEGDTDETRRARKMFHIRLNATPGVVSATAKDAYEGSLIISPIEYAPNAATEANFKKLRETMCRPDGWALTEALQVWAVARLLSLGLHYEWSPAAPTEWLESRKLWAKYVRDTLAESETAKAGIDSELQVTNAVLDGRLEDEFGLLDAWLKVKPTFEINPKPVWHDDTALSVCANWLANNEGICWVEHRFFGTELSRRTGAPYFGAKGLDPKGNFIEDAKGPIIASIAANAEGRNLQRIWSANLVTAPPSDSERWEQLLARTHRRGQREDEVTVDVLVGCREHLESIPRARSSSQVKRDLLGARQKIALADISDWPDTHAPRQGFRWV